MAESTFRLDEKESLTVERLSYIYESNKAVATILARELADAENSDAKEMLREVCNSCRASFLEMRVAQDTVLSSRIDDFYSKRVEFAFDFKAQEVRCNGDSERRLFQLCPPAFQQRKPWPGSLPKCHFSGDR